MQPNQSNLFKVPSFTNDNVCYLIDLNICVCQCIQGCNVALCKHQYVLWSRQFSSNATNFLPVFSSVEKRRYTELALNISGPIKAYEGLRDNILHQNATADLNADFDHDSTPRPDEVTASPALGSSTLQTPTSPSPGCSQDQDITLLEQADETLDSAMSYLRSTLLLRDPQLLSGYVKWSKNQRYANIASKQCISLFSQK